MKRFNFKAVAFGALLDIGGTTVALALLSAVLGWHRRGNSPPMLLVDSVGLAFSFFAGVLAARLARNRELMHAFATAVPCFVLGLCVPTKAVSLPAWQLFLSHVAGFPFALLGGYCARRCNRADATE